MVGKVQNTAAMWKKKNRDIDDPTSYLDHANLGCTQRECEPNEAITKNHEEHIASKGFTSMSHCNLVHKFIPMSHK